MIRNIAAGRRSANRALRLGLYTAGVTGTSIFGSTLAVAQISPQSLPSQGEVSRERLTLPPVETPQFDLRIQAPDKSAIPKAVDTIEFEVRKIDVEGVTAFPPAQVNAFFAPLIGKTVDIDAVRRAAQALEDLYRQKGFFLSRVFIPPQQLYSATVKIRVIEGFIDDITVEGLDSGARGAIERALAPLRELRPIDLASLERQLLILNDMPGITGTGVLRPGTRLGGSDLIVSLETRRNTYAINFNNSGSRILGPWGYTANANLNRPLGMPGALNIVLGAGGRELQAVQSASARYSLALGTHGLLASFGVLAAKARPGGSIRALDIRNQLLSISARARYPIIRSRANSLFAEGGLSVNRSDTDILGQRLVQDKTTVGDLGLIFQQNGWYDGSTTVSASIFQAIPAFGANKRGTPLASTLDFDPQFTRLAYSIQRVQRLPVHLSTLVSIQGQFTGSKLLSGERVSFGGPSIGRGFDPSAITGDRGVGGLVELRYDQAISKSWVYNAQYYTFFDGARTTSLATATVPKTSQRIQSVGLGARIFHKYGLIDFQGAYARRRIGGGDERPNPRALVSATFLF